MMYVHVHAENTLPTRVELLQDSIVLHPTTSVLIHYIRAFSTPRLLLDTLFDAALLLENVWYFVVKAFSADRI